MVQALDTLPDDPAVLKAIIQAEREEAARVTASMRAYEALIEALRIQIARLKRQRYGHSSEKIDREIEQLEMALEGLEIAQAAEGNTPPPAEDDATADSEPETDDVTRKPPRRRGKPRVAPDTPRETITLDPGESCPDCGGPLRLLGEDVSQILDFIAAKLKLVETVRPKKSCRCCEKVVQEPAPTRPIERGMAGPGLLAHIIVAKYDDHLPLYRQTEILARMGADIPRSTMIDWCGRGVATLAPLIERIREIVMAADRLHGDDTPIRVLDPSVPATKGRKRAVKEGRIWAYVHDDRPWDGSDPAGRVLLLARPQGRAPAEASRRVRGHPAGRRLRRVSQALRARAGRYPADPGGGVPSSRGCCHPRPSQIRTCRTTASGSSRWSFAADSVLVNDPSWRQGVSRQVGPEPIPLEPAGPTASSEPLPPHPFDLMLEPTQATSVSGHAIVGVVAAQHGGQVSVLFGERPVPVRPAPCLHGEQRSRIALLVRHLPHDVLASPGSAPDMGEPEKAERRASRGRMRLTVRPFEPEVDHPRLLGMEGESKPSQPLPQHTVDPLAVEEVLESQNSVVRVPDQRRGPLHAGANLAFEPIVQHIVQEQIRKRRRDHTALRGPRGRPGERAVLQHTRLQPLVDHPPDDTVGHPLVEKRPEMCV